jgi:hypothetical protein
MTTRTPSKPGSTRRSRRLGADRVAGGVDRLSGDRSRPRMPELQPAHTAELAPLSVSEPSRTPSANTLVPQVQLRRYVCRLTAEFQW